MKIIVLLAIILAVSIAQDESPRWPDRFCEDFTETFTYGWLGPYQTTGKMCYDWNQKRYAVHRDNGHWDRYCGFDYWHIWGSAPCVHYVDSGVRYLYYPNSDSCCHCCDSVHGCDVLQPNWLSGASFVGEVTFQGQMAYKWDKKGLQSNFYYETVAMNATDRIMLGIDQQPNDFQIFDPSTFTTEFDDSLITMPAKCQGAGYCNLGICTAVRHA